MSQKLLTVSINSLVVRYGTAILLNIGALLLTLAIWSFVNPLSSPLFFVAILITAWQRGFGPGVFATLLAGILIDYFFIMPNFGFGGSFEEVSRLNIFALEGIILCWFVTARTKAAQEIQDSREQLLALSLRQQTLREEERKQIALEIHDELGQSLTGLKMVIHLLNRQIKDSCHPESDAINEKLKDLLYLIDDSIHTVRRIATELRPAVLDDLGLVAAIEWQAVEFQRRTGISCSFSSNIESIEISDVFSIAIFRVLQESLTNIMRHAEASHVLVDLNKTDEHLVLRIEDNGKGITLEEINRGHSLGIFGLRERARLLGGELQIFKGSESGTTILLTAPLT